MIKLDTPLGMLLTVAVLVIFSVYAFLIWSIEGSWMLLLAGVASIVASIGTALLKPWSRYFVYALTAAFISKLTWSIIVAVRAGFFGFQFGSSTEVLRSLAPSLFMALLSCACCWIVYRQFDARRSLRIAVDGHTGSADSG